MPPGGEYEFDFDFYVAEGVDELFVGFVLGVVSTGDIDATISVGRLDGDRDYMGASGGLVSYSGFRTVNNVLESEFSFGASDLGEVNGLYTIRLGIVNSSSSGVDLRVDNFFMSMRPYGSASEVVSGYSYNWFSYSGTELELELELSALRVSASESGGVLDVSTLGGISLLRSGSALNGLGSGVYVAEARLDPSGGCPLLPVGGVLVEDVDGGGVTISITEESAVTSCVESNGILSAGVSVNGSLTTDGHTFEWFETSQLLNSVFVGSRAERLSAASYTVRVRNDVSGCVSSADYSVGSSFSSPVLRIDEVNAVVSCVAGALGSAGVSVGGEVSGYSFEWYFG